MPKDLALAALRESLRRWHPDKFLQRYGSIVPEKELAYMTFRVNEFFKPLLFNGI